MPLSFSNPCFLGLTNSLSTTPEIFLDGHIAIAMPAVYAATTLTYYGYDSTQGYVPLYDSGGTAVTQTVTVARVYNLPSTVVSHKRIKIVTNSATDTSTVTFTNATNVVNWTSHGLSAGAAVYFSGGTAPAELSFPGVYYVETASSANTFTLKSTLAGSVIDLTTDGSGTIKASRAVELIAKG